MKGTNVLTLCTIGMYTPIFSMFHGLPTYACVGYTYTYMTYMHAVQICSYQLLENGEHMGYSYVGSFFTLNAVLLQKSQF